jgi:uncharacterized caspase-like protein
MAGVRALPLEPGVEPSAVIDAAGSAALFVGIREFPHDKKLTEVQYAVDDAVDLAYMVAIERSPRLVDPKRVILALSGEPQKAASTRHLQALLAAGALQKPAASVDILTLLEEQARAVGRNGLLIVSFATHGVNDGGTQYLLTESSLVQYRESTAISEATVREIVSRAGVPRSLILLDACRERLRADSRATEADPRSAAALLRGIADVHGQVVLSAAVAGEYAYDDESRRNGVFTAAVIDGLRCGAATDERGFVTVDTLSSYVEDKVLTWIQKHRDPKARRATQLQYEGRAKDMPLSKCLSGTASALSTPH